MALSGGSTLRVLYERLAAAEISWQNIHLFWSDERCVPSDHPDSNYRSIPTSVFADGSILVEPSNDELSAKLFRTRLE